MGTSQILRPRELHFYVPERLEIAINELLEAMGRDDINTDCYMDEVRGMAREVSEEDDRWIVEYYLRGGYLKTQSGSCQPAAEESGSNTE